MLLYRPAHNTWQAGLASITRRIHGRSWMLQKPCLILDCPFHYQHQHHSTIPTLRSLAPLWNLEQAESSSGGKWKSKNTQPKSLQPQSGESQSAGSEPTQHCVWLGGRDSQGEKVLWMSERIRVEKGPWGAWNRRKPSGKLSASQHLNAGETLFWSI